MLPWPPLLLTTGQRSLPLQGWANSEAWEAEEANGYNYYNLALVYIREYARLFSSHSTHILLLDQKILK